MEIEILTPEEVRDYAAEGLGVGRDHIDLLSPAFLGAALRRAATFHCPCTEETLIRAVVEPFNGVVEDLQGTREICQDAIEQLVRCGDLLELWEAGADVSESLSRVLQPAPPSFVRRQGGFVLLGIAPDGIMFLPDDLADTVRQRGFLRFLENNSDEDLGSQLVELGLNEIPNERWLKTPQLMDASQFITNYRTALDSKVASGEVPGLTILDPTARVTYYPARWTQPSTQSGDFVARRPRKYGPELWCYARLENGQPIKLLDLPLLGSELRGCDEAWTLQAAIDAERGNPQVVEVECPNPEVARVKLFSPIPLWVTRRWTLVGEEQRPKGCLVAFDFHKDQVAEELEFARRCLWLDLQD